MLFLISYCSLRVFLLFFFFSHSLIFILYFFVFYFSRYLSQLSVTIIFHTVIGCIDRRYSGRGIDKKSDLLKLFTFLAIVFNVFCIARYRLNSVTFFSGGRGGQPAHTSSANFNSLITKTSYL